MEAGSSKAHFSIPSIIAILAAIGSFSVGAAAGFLLALVAIGFGIIGVLLSMAPSVRGGLVSIFSMLAGAIGIIAALFKAIAWAVHGA